MATWQKSDINDIKKVEKVVTRTELLVIGYIRILQQHLSDQIIPDSIANFCYSFYPQPNDTDDGIFDTLENIVISISMDLHNQFCNSKAFLLCFPEFTNTMQILEIIKYRLSINASPYCIHTNFASHQVQQGIINFFEYWINNYFKQDFDGNDDALQYMENQICTTILQSSSSQEKIKLIDSLKECLTNAQKASSDTKTNQDDIKMDDNKKDDDDDKDYKIDVDKFLSFDAKTFAQQLTLWNFEQYEKINAREFINESWKARVNNGRDAPNILNFIKNSNGFAYWLQYLILIAKDLKQRNKVLQHCLLIGKYLKELSNLNSLSMLNASVQSTPIHRLKVLWKKLPKKSTKIKDEISQFCSPNSSHFKMRSLLMNNIKNKIPTIPSIMLFLQDISLMYDGMKLRIFDGDDESVSIEKMKENMTLRKSEKINHQRLDRIYNHINDKALIYKQFKYLYEKDDQYQQFITHNIYQCGIDFDEEKLYQMSTKIKEDVGFSLK